MRPLSISALLEIDHKFIFMLCVVQLPQQMITLKSLQKCLLQFTCYRIRQTDRLRKILVNIKTFSLPSPETALSKTNGTATDRQRALCLAFNHLLCIKLARFLKATNGSEALLSDNVDN